MEEYLKTSQLEAQECGPDRGLRSLTKPLWEGLHPVLHEDQAVLRRLRVIPGAAAVPVTAGSGGIAVGETDWRRQVANEQRAKLRPSLYSCSYSEGKPNIDRGREAASGRAAVIVLEEGWNAGSPIGLS